MATRAGRAEMIGRMVGLMPLISDDDIEALLSQMVEAAKRAPLSAGKVFRDPVDATDALMHTGMLPKGVPHAAEAAAAPGEPDPDQSPISPLSPKTAQAETSAMVTFNFGGMDDGAGAEDDDDDEEEGGRKLTVSVTDDSTDQQLAGQYAGSHGGGTSSRRGRRKTVSSEVINLEDVDHYVPPVHHKTAAESAWLRESLKDEWLFEHLEDFELDVLIQAMFKQELHCGDTIFVEDETGDTYKVIQQGTAQSTENSLDGTETAIIGTCGPGWKCGEEDLMYATEARYTVTVTSPNAKVWCLQRHPYRFIVTKASVKKRAMYEEFLSKITFLKGMTNFSRLQVADALKSVTYSQGEKLITYGDEGRYFFIIVEGVVKVYGREGDTADHPTKYVCDFGVGDCVGELEFVHGHRCVADVIASTPTVRVAKMGKKHFEKVMGPVSDVLKQRAMEDSKFAYYRGTGAAGGQ
eukprot:TRINITY_DN6020_c0_g1_i1.p1 TRINITY_DN6020_c0_g1~~TRINITY_DN6020_c0_g1_i1.p1  ORF type:complete len:502 (+),score=160.32 TRINITY_DN6020_c0_g1_i1:112-1506(+)